MNILDISIKPGGRCFVVGDVAGHFKGLSSLIDHLDLNPRHDRLVLNGNFLGFAPSSRLVLPWLQKEWVTAILGPNEAGVMARLRGDVRPTLAGQWLDFLGAKDRDMLKMALE